MELYTTYKVKVKHYNDIFKDTLTVYRDAVKFYVAVCMDEWNTLKLAFDGSDPVVRGVDGNYSMCKFVTGKIYNCDLSASYNIGARYFIREILKSLPEKARLRLEAKVPLVCKRSTCTLSTLISLNAVLASA